MVASNWVNTGVKKLAVVVLAGMLAACSLSPPPSPVRPSPPLRQTLAPAWLDAAGQIKWPPKDGFSA